MALQLKIKAYAKINLFLKVLAKRDDGFHEVETILQNIDLADTLLFQKADDLTVQCAEVKSEDNLVLKAARLLASTYDVKEGVNIILNKNIPIEAGLGGGSSDAAATLVALNRLWDLNLNKETLFDLGKQLGSDVNFFIEGGIALAKGRGEIIEPIKTSKNLLLVIAKPDFGISAKEAYCDWDRQTGSASTGMDYEKLFNDLERPVLNRYPKLKEYFDIGYKHRALKVMLSGSGSAFFAIVEGKEIQDSVYRAWQGQGLKIYKTKTIDRSFDIET